MHCVMFGSQLQHNSKTAPCSVWKTEPDFHLRPMQNIGSISLHFQDAGFYVTGRKMWLVSERSIYAYVYLKSVLVNLVANCILFINT